jgi:hypothetical protein
MLVRPTVKTLTGNAQVVLVKVLTVDGERAGGVLAAGSIAGTMRE